MNRTAAALLASFGAILLASPVLAQEEPDTDQPTDETGRVELSLLDQTFDLAPNGDIELLYRITGDLEQVAELLPEPEPAATESTTTTSPDDDTDETDGDDEAPPPVQIDVRVLNFEPIDVDTDLDDIVGPDPRRLRLPPVIDGVDLFDVRSDVTVESPTEATLAITVPTDTEVSVSERLQFDDDGIHPVLVELRVGGNVVADHGTLVERRSESTLVPPPVDLALFARAPDPGPSAPAPERRESVEEFADLIDLAAATGPSITFDVAPSIVSALAAGDRLADDALADDEILSAPATPFDISSAAAVDRVDAFRRQLVAGEDDVSTALGRLPTRDIWHPTTPLSGQGAQVLRDLGVRYLAVTDQLFEATIAPLDTVLGHDRFIPIELPDGTTMPLMLIDETFGAMFTAENTDAVLAERTPVEWSIATVATLRLEQLDGPLAERTADRSRLIAAPGLGSFDPRLVAELERFAGTTDAIRFTRASQLLAGTDTVRTDQVLTLPETAGPSLEARLARIAEVQFALADTASMLPDDDERPPAWERRLDSFVSTSFGDAEVNAELDALLAESTELREGVVAPEAFTFTLTGDGEITIRIGNRLAEPLEVVLRLRSPRLAFPDGDVAVTLAPDDTTDVIVPIEIRSNGTSVVTVDVTTPAGIELIEPVTLTSRVNALTGYGQVLTGAFLLVLFTWWFSHWRSRRRDAAEARDAVVSN